MKFVKIFIFLYIVGSITWLFIINFKKIKNLIPNEDNKYTLGSKEKRWNSLYVGEGVQTTAYVVPTSNTFNPFFDSITPAVQGITIQTGNYTMVTPKLCYYRVFVDFAGCTNFGTTQYKITLPFRSKSNFRNANGLLHQFTGDIYYHIAGHIELAQSATVVKLYYSGSTSELAWKNTTPVGATTITSHFDISGIYEIE